MRFLTPSLPAGPTPSPPHPISPASFTHSRFCAAAVRYMLLLWLAACRGQAPSTGREWQHAVCTDCCTLEAPCRQLCTVPPASHTQLAMLSKRHAGVASISHNSLATRANVPAAGSAPGRRPASCATSHLQGAQGRERGAVCVREPDLRLAAQAVCQSGCRGAHTAAQASRSLLPSHFNPTPNPAASDPARCRRRAPGWR